MFYDSVNETGKKQIRMFAGFGWIRPESPRYCADLLTMCTYVEKTARIDHELVKNTPNAAQIGHEFSTIRHDPRDFL